MTSPVDLKGMVAVVTGGGRGLGRAFAQALAGVGCSVAVVARSEAELAETVGLIGRAGGQAQAFPADITDAGAVDVAFAAIEQSFGAVDLLVNNAGVIGPIAPFAETTPDAWWRSVEVNLKGPMLISRRVLPGMIARGKGRIINLVTGVAPFAYFSGYCAGKAALIRFSECLAAEVRPHGVTVFPMGPGTVRTAMSEHSLNSPEGRKWLPWFKRIFDEGLDLPPERPAELVVRLASGRYDALSGLTLNPRDDLDEILARLEEVEHDKLYSMRLRTIPNGCSADRGGAQCRDAGVFRDAGARRRTPPGRGQRAGLRALDQRRRLGALVPAAGGRGMDRDADGRPPTGRTHRHRRAPARPGIPPQRGLRRDRGSRSARLPLELGRGLSLWRPRRHRSDRGVPS
jgi:NAD(P)-dependent dehydrogenase (short-subunit alcohol dehydrogenase family)